MGLTLTDYMTKFDRYYNPKDIICIIFLSKLELNLQKKCKPYRLL